jgi:GNAT superfamily N-acetyltransferase
MKDFRITIEPHAAESQKQLIWENLGLYNVAKTGHEEYYPVSIFLRDKNDEVLGGVLGHIWGQWLYVADLWLSAPVRRGGHGSKLLAAAERYALEKGCRNVWLSTHSFQARPFYEKLGYEVFGQLDDFPPGHKLYFLKKHLTAQRPSASKQRRALDEEKASPQPRAQALSGRKKRREA